MFALVLTVIGDDRAGLVHALAEVIAGHGGNWENSRLARLAGKFAGVVEVGIDPASVDELVAALASLDGRLEVTAHPATPAPETQTVQFALSLVGADHPGIVQEISGVLSGAGVNVLELSTEQQDAPMAGGKVFVADAILEAPAGTDIDSLARDLERLATDLMVDISVDA